MDTTNALASVDQLLALRMHLMCALTADKCGKDDVAYDMVSQAFVLYEDEISDSKQQVELVMVFTGTLRSLTRCTAETYDNLVSKATLYATSPSLR
jgi:vacuolar protein sorting-associated protein 35